MTSAINNVHNELSYQLGFFALLGNSCSSFCWENALGHSWMLPTFWYATSLIQKGENRPVSGLPISCRPQKFKSALPWWCLWEGSHGSSSCHLPGIKTSSGTATFVQFVPSRLGHWVWGMFSKQLLLGYVHHLLEVKVASYYQTENQKGTLALKMESHDILHS